MALATFQPKEWSLGEQLMIDALAGTVTACTLTPIIAPMDAGIVESTTGRISQRQAILSRYQLLLTRPHRYLVRPEARILSTVISLTYATKNASSSITRRADISAETAAFWKFWAVTAVNMSLCVFWRDPAFAKLFDGGVSAAKKQKVAVISYALWFGRDASHFLGVIVPDYLEQRMDLTIEEWRRVQFAGPLVAQLLCAPFHLMGYDYYNFPQSKFSARFGRVGKLWLPTAGVRMVRMIPPWSIGLILNRSILDYFAGSDLSSHD